MRPDFSYCGQCADIHPPNKHIKQAKFVLADSAEILVEKLAEAAVPDKPKRQKTIKIDPVKTAAGFEKNKFMQRYMLDRREADRAGFGGSRDPGSTRYNPKFMTVVEYRDHRAAQKALQTV